MFQPGKRNEFNRISFTNLAPPSPDTKKEVKELVKICAQSVELSYATGYTTLKQRRNLLAH